MQLPFAIIPLVAVHQRSRANGSFAKPGWVRGLAWTTAGIIVGLNAWLASQQSRAGLPVAGSWRTLILLAIVPAVVLLVLLLVWITSNR